MYTKKYRAYGTTALLGAVVLLTTSCSRDKTSHGEVYLLTTGELNNLLDSADTKADFSAVRIELLHRELQPSHSQELASHIIANHADPPDPAALTVAWAAKSLSLAEPDDQELSKQYALRAMAYSESCPENTRAQAAALYAKARYLWRNRKWEKAYLDFRQLLSLAQEQEDCSDYCVRARNGLGSVAVVSGAMVRARHYFIAATEQKTPPSQGESKVQPAINLGILAWRNGLYKEALVFFDRADTWARDIEKTEWLAEIYRGTTMCNLELGKLEEAKKSLELAKANMAETSSSRRRLLEGVQILLATEQNKAKSQDLLPRADQWLAKFKDNAPAYRSALALYGRTLSALDRPDSAIAAFNEILAIKPDEDRPHQVVALRKIAKIQFSQGKQEEANRTLIRLSKTLQKRYTNQLESEYSFSGLESRIDAKDFAQREKQLYKQRSRLRYWLVGVSLLAGSGASLGLVALRRDRGRRLSAESEKDQSFHEKEELESRLQSTLQQKRRLEALGELTGGVAHDFNNLLTVIMNSNELLMLRLQEEQESKELLELVGQSLNASELAAEITHQLLAFGRKQPLRPEILDLTALLSSIEGLLRRTISPLNDLEILSEDLTENPLVRIDRPQLITALINLCSNSRDAIGTKADGRIEIQLKTQVKHQSVGHNNTYHEISVTDNGCGMSQLAIERACEPFFTTKDKSSGVGLGLSTVHGFVIQSGGELQIDSELGKFTKVSILLPAANDNQSDQTVKLARTNPNVSSIMVVDDDQHIRESIKKILAVHEIEATLASDSEQAKELLATGTAPDLVLSDIRMKTPTEGIDFAHWLSKKYPKVRVVLISGYYDAEGVEEFEVVRKPFSRSTLDAALGLE